MPDVLPLDVRLMHTSASVLFALVALACVVSVGAWFVRLPMFTLDGVRVEGDTARTNVSSIRTHALPRLAGNFFTIDLAQARAAFESVPWVRRARVQRVWPDRLAVQIEEHRVAGWWVDDSGGERLVNSFGEVFEANPGDIEDEHLPHLRGPDAGSAAAVLSMHRALVPLFARLQRKPVALAMSARGSWRVELDSGARVELGRGTRDEVLARTETFVETLPQLTARYGRALVHADLRHADGYALRLQGIATVTPETRQGARN